MCCFFSLPLRRPRKPLLSQFWLSCLSRSPSTLNSGIYRPLTRRQSETPRRREPTRDTRAWRNPSFLLMANKTEQNCTVYVSSRQKLVVEKKNPTLKISLSFHWLKNVWSVFSVNPSEVMLFLSSVFPAHRAVMIMCRVPCMSKMCR